MPSCFWMCGFVLFFFEVQSKINSKCEFFHFRNKQEKVVKREKKNQTKWELSIKRKSSLCFMTKIGKIEEINKPLSLSIQEVRPIIWGQESPQAWSLFHTTACCFQTETPLQQGVWDQSLWRPCGKSISLCVLVRMHLCTKWYYSEPTWRLN